MSDIKTRIILITGSSTGIGYELVRILAEKGHVVYMSGRNELKGLEAQQKLKKQHGLNVKFIRLDITDKGSITAAKELIEKGHGYLDVLVNNAGSAVKPQFPDNWEDEATLEIFNINLFAVVQTTSAFLPLIRKAGRGYGVILNISSTTASNTLAAQGVFTKHLSPRSAASAYSAAKTALNSYTISLGHMLQAEDIKVNCATPGVVKTALNIYSSLGKTPAEGAEVFVPWILLGPEDRDKTVKFGGPKEWADESGAMLW